MKNCIRPLQVLRKKHRKNQTEIAKYLGITRQTYAKIEQSEICVSSEHLIKLADLYQVSTDYLLERNVNPNPFEHTSTLTVYGYTGAILKDWFTGLEELSVNIPRPPEMNDPSAFGIIAKGTSLFAEGIRPGYLCIVSPAHPYQLGDVVFVKNKKGESCLKRFSGENPSWLYLEGFLPSCPQGMGGTFDESVEKEAIDTIAPIICVKRRYF